jgi:hypothetical protein
MSREAIPSQPKDAMSESKQPDGSSKAPRTDREVYNLVTDTVAGPNVRLKDNLYQGLAILVCMVLGAGIGSLTVAEKLLGAVVGAGIGLLVGLFGSGLFLMIYRFAKHAKGRHD